MRKYEPIWLEIKKRGSCKIKPASPNVLLYQRIKQAVMKEKCADITFKVEMDDRRLKLEILRREDGTIVFTLLKSIGATDL